MGFNFGNTYWSVDPYIKNGTAQTVAAQRQAIKDAGFTLYQRFKTKDAAEAVKAAILKETGIDCEVYEGTMI